MLNKIVIMGRLVADPEMRRTQSGTGVCSFTIACERDFADKSSGEKETDFFDCVAWHRTADFVEQYFSKGKMAVVAGRLQKRSWTDKDGRKRETAEIVVENMYFAESKRENNNFAPITDADDSLPF